MSDVNNTALDLVGRRSSILKVATWICGSGPICYPHPILSSKYIQYLTTLYHPHAYYLGPGVVAILSCLHAMAACYGFLTGLSASTSVLTSLSYPQQLFLTKQPEWCFEKLVISCHSTPYVSMVLTGRKPSIIPEYNPTSMTSRTAPLLCSAPVIVLHLRILAVVVFFAWRTLLDIGIHQVFA